MTPSQGIAGRIEALAADPNAVVLRAAAIDDAATAVQIVGQAEDLLPRVSRRSLERSAPGDDLAIPRHRCGPGRRRGD